MRTKFFSDSGDQIDVTKYPDYSKTKYVNWSKETAEKRRLPFLYDRKEACCGCFACYSICPKSAINMLEDLEGFVYPVIDIHKCVACYRCESVCPIKSIKAQCDEVNK